MAGVLDSVNKRTQLVGDNRLELLLFRLNGSQLYGINVFKVREVLQCPPLTNMPKLHSIIRGVAHIRGGTMSIMDLGLAIGNSALKDLDDTFVIITEYNRGVQGFLVKAVDRIVNLQWGDVHPPPKGAGRNSYLTAVTEIDGKLIEIIDVEKVLSEVAPKVEEISEGVVDEETIEKTRLKEPHVLIVDDSMIARKQVQKCVESLGIEATTLKNGKEALDYLLGMADTGEKASEKFMMVISDIEMPEMDGYTLTAELRADSRLSDLHIVLHTSLSGVFNEAMVAKVGADAFLAKFDPDSLAKHVQDRVKAL